MQQPRTGAGVVTGECPLEPCSSRCCAILQSAAVLHSVLHCCVHLPISFFSASFRVRGKGRGFKKAETMKLMETEDGRGHTSDDEHSMNA